MQLFKYGKIVEMNKDTQTTSQDSRIIRNAFYIQFVAYLLAIFPTAFVEVFDGIIIGQYLGVDSVAAFGIVSPLIAVYAMSGAVISAGARKRYIRHIGQGNTEKAQAVFSLSCVLAVGIAVFAMLMIIVFSTPITRLLGAKGSAADLLPKARSYLIGVTIGLPARNLMWVLWILMAVDSDRNLPIISSVVMAVSNILLDLFVVKVLHGHTFAMGLVTSVCYVLAIFVLLTHFRRKNRLLKFSLRNLPWQETTHVFQLGSYSGICKISTMLRGSYMNNLLAVIASTTAIAAYSVHRQTGILLGPLMISMADTVSVLAGLLNAERDRPMLKKLLSTAVKANLIVTLAVSCLLFVFAGHYAALFIAGDTATMGLAKEAVRAYSIGMVIYGLNSIYFYYLQSTGKKVLASVTGFLLEGGFMIASAAVLSRFIGARAVWFAFPATQLIMLIYYTVIYNYQSRKMGIWQLRMSDQILLLPKDFDVPQEDQLEVSITTLDEVMGLSQQVWDFCDRHDCDERRKYLLSLAVEEMAGNVIEHGFTKDSRQHSVDVRIVKDKDSYILRIRDDCLIFDPIGRLELYSNEDMTKHIGIRMIVNMSQEVRHTCFLKLNNLFVKV